MAPAKNLQGPRPASSPGAREAEGSRHRARRGRSRRRRSSGRAQTCLRTPTGHGVPCQAHRRRRRPFRPATARVRPRPSRATGPVQPSNRRSRRANRWRSPSRAPRWCWSRCRVAPRAPHGWYRATDSRPPTVRRRSRWPSPMTPWTSVPHPPFARSRRFPARPRRRARASGIRARGSRPMTLRAAPTSPSSPPCLHRDRCAGPLPRCVLRRVGQRGRPG